MKKYIIILSAMLLFAGCSATVKPAPQTPPTSDQTGQTKSQFTLSQLALYNGKNGAKAYIAISGIVYDVTNVAQWRNGAHNGYQAGVDLTAAFANSPHSASILAGLSKVGTLVK
jgi:predicted heme/steroid binding protein